MPTVTVDKSVTVQDTAILFGTETWETRPASRLGATFASWCQCASDWGQIASERTVWHRDVGHAPASAPRAASVVDGLHLGRGCKAGRVPARSSPVYRWLSRPLTSIALREPNWPPVGWKSPTPAGQWASRSSR